MTHPSTLDRGTRGRRRLAAVLSLGIALFGAGCSEHRPPDELAKAVTMGERPVAMEGATPFFDGVLNVTVTISRGIGHGMPGGIAGGGHGGGGRQEMPDVSNMDPDDAEAYIRARMAVGSPMPPVTLHLKLENLSKGTVQADILEMNSDLGNFAVQPELLAMAPGQTSEPDPMVSQLGVTSDVIPVKVTLRMGGKTESETIQVRNLSAPPPPNSPPPLRTD